MVSKSDASSVCIYFLILINLFFVSCTELQDEGTCTSEDGSCSAENQNSKNSSVLLSQIQNEHNLILSKIYASLDSYVECNATYCGCHLRTLFRDLHPFKDGITKSLIDEIRGKGTTYVIHDNRLYRDKDCLFPSRCSGIEYFLRKLLPRAENVEMIINTRDWPQMSKHFNMFGPVLSFSKTKDYLDIMYPAWSFWEGGPAISTYPTGLGRWDLLRKTLLNEAKSWPWSKKKPIGFFRGSRTSEKRDNLILLSREKPHLVDAQYTKNQAWKSSADTLDAEPAAVVPLEYHCQFKYLFNFRGVAASFRFKHLFLCGSLVIHVGDEWQEFFYPALKPWVHYIPLPDDFTQDDVVKLLEFLESHDELAKDIADRGQKFIVEHLGMKEIFCYWRRLIRRYSKLLKYTVEPDSSLIEIT